MGATGDKMLGTFRLHLTHLFSMARKSYEDDWYTRFKLTIDIKLERLYLDDNDSESDSDAKMAPMLIYWWMNFSVVKPDILTDQGHTTWLQEMFSRYWIYFCMILKFYCEEIFE